MNIKRVTYMALGAFVFAASCSKEAAEPDVFDWGDGKIYFKPSISDVAGSRAQDMTLSRLEAFHVTCFNSADPYTDKNGYLSPYFENAKFVRKSESNPLATYVSPPDEIPWGWPSNDGLLRFFAFSPSLVEMSKGVERDDTVRLINRSIRNASSVSIAYRLGNVRINPDISKQFDFIAAQAAGERWKDFAGGVELGFSHLLSQVELRAWGDASAYDFEIAGVRIGNPVVEGTFVFADDSAPDRSWGWEMEGEGMKEKVEYFYIGSNVSDDPLAAGDRIFRINNSEHNTAESAGSIMGKGGCAMVIPTRNPRWEGTADPNITNVPYSTDRMYFSVLTRVIDKTSGEVIYPYPDDKSGMTVISYAMDAEGRILTRLYAGQTPGSYFTDKALQHPYAKEAGTEIKDFGWAAVPVDADWSAGKRYIYTLNFSDGIGLHVPEDPEPGKPIAGKSPTISWGVSVEIWNYAEKDENFDPELNVP